MNRKMLSVGIAARPKGGSFSVADTVAEIALGRGCERPYIACRPFGGPLPSELDQSSDAAERLARHVRRHGVDHDFFTDYFKR